MNNKCLKTLQTNLDYHFSEVLEHPYAKPYWIYVSLSHKCTYNCKMCGVVKILKGHELKADVIKEAKSVLASGRSIILEFDFTGTDVNNSGMICGGKSTVLLEYLGATSDNTDFFRRLYEALMRGDDCSLLTLYRGSGRAVDD